MDFTKEKDGVLNLLLSRFYKYVLRVEKICLISQGLDLQRKGGNGGELRQKSLVVTNNRIGGTNK